VREQERVVAAVADTKRLTRELSVSPTDSERSLLVLAVSARAALFATSVLLAAYLDCGDAQRPHWLTLHLVCLPGLVFNAVFAATGKRVRMMPVRPADLA